MYVATSRTKPYSDDNQNRNNENHVIFRSLQNEWAEFGSLLIVASKRQANVSSSCRFTKYYLGCLKRRKMLCFSFFFFEFPLIAFHFFFVFKYSGLILGDYRTNLKKMFFIHFIGLSYCNCIICKQSGHNLLSFKWSKSIAHWQTNKNIPYGHEFVLNAIELVWSVFRWIKFKTKRSQ